MSSLISEVSTETRVPGVSAASIASNTRAAATMSSAVSKYCRTTGGALLGVGQQLQAAAGRRIP